MNVIIRILFICTLCMSVSCEDGVDLLPIGKYEKGILISNEGNFSDADGSVGFLDTDPPEMRNRIFEAENNRPFGGLLQSISIHLDKGYLIDNLGDRIEVVDINSFESIGTISAGLLNPRYFEAENTFAYITNWGPYAMDFTSPESFIAVLDLETNTIIQEIEVPSRPEGLLITNGKLFVSSLLSDTVTLIDINTNERIASLKTGFGPAHFVKDQRGYVWVACTGGNLILIDPEAHTILENIFIGNLSGNISVDRSGEVLYLLTNRYSEDFTFTENEVLKVTISSPVSATTIFSSRNLYGIGVDPLTGIIYLGNSNAFSGNGTVIRIGRDGQEIDNFLAGRGPNGFVFLN